VLDVVQNQEQVFLLQEGGDHLLQRLLACIPPIQGLGDCRQHECGVSQWS
jgi:hypothetical protein